jgi:uncharacterized membrane-anchored protein YitT (DUF2179 family)
MSIPPPGTAAIKRRREALAPGTWPRRGWDAVLLVAGTWISAFAFNHFLVPHGVACGGVVGMSAVLETATGLPPAAVQIAANLLILLLALLTLGRGAALRALAGSLMLPLAVAATAGGSSWAGEPLLGALAGGIGIGVGVGLTLRSGWTIGGFGLLARILDRRCGWGVARILAVLDGAIVVAAGVVHQAPQAAVLALVAVFATARAVDLANAGLSRAKGLWIISRRHAEIRQAVLHVLDLGCTVVPARGGLTDEPTDMLMVVVPPGDLWRVKRLVADIDPQAFTIVADAHEVLGHGFRPHA